MSLASVYLSNKSNIFKFETAFPSFAPEHGYWVRFNELNTEKTRFFAFRKWCW